MAVTYATVTRTALGPGPKRRFSFYPETVGNVVTIAAEDYEHAGPFEVTTAASGAFTIAIPTGCDQGGNTLLWKIVETPIDKIPGRSGGPLAAHVIGYSTINASIGYDDLIAGLVTPSTVTPDLVENVAGYATTAQTAATTATTKAGEASGSAAAALSSAADSDSSADLAAVSESNAASSASTASTQAGIATTKAGEAATSASTATTKASEASTSAATATTKASEAATSATAAQGYASSAAGSVSLAAWAPSTAYTAGDVRQAPDGSSISRLSSGTSRPSFDATEQALWEAVVTKTGTIAQAAISTTYVGRVGLFSSLAATPPTVAASVNMVRTEGYASAGEGWGVYIYDAAVNSAYVTANPRTSFLAAGGRGFRLNPRNVTPYMFGAVGDGTTNDATALQAFLTFIAANDVGVADASGNYATATGLTFGSAGSGPATRAVTGKFALTATGSGAAAFTITDWNLGSWQHMKLTAPQGGTTNYAARTWHTGLHVTGSTQRCRFGTIEGTDWAFGLAVASGGNTSGNDYGIVKATACGSGAVSGATHYGLTTSWSNPVNSGSSGSVSQTCTIDVATLPPSYISSGFHGAVNDAPYMIRITNNLDGTTRLHYITAVDTVNSKLTVFPWINPAITPSTADYVYGGALYLQGADSNVSTYSLVDAIRCGVAVSAASLYAPTAGRIITQVCGTGIVLGRVPTGAVLGGRFSGYFESNTEDIIYLSRPISSNVYTWFSNEYALDLAKCYVAGAAKLSSTFADTDAHRGFENTAFAYQGRMHAYEKRPGAPSSTQIVPINRADMQLRLAGNTFTITPSIDTNLNRMFGYDSMRVTITGTGTNGAPTGTITFPVPSGYTLNGGASAVAFSSFTGPAEFIYRFDVAGGAATVRQLAQPALSNTATLDFPSIAAAGQQELTITVTGAVVGDVVMVGPPAALEAGLQVSAYVSAANAVKIRLSNVTAAAIDPASATWKAAVIR